jgi:hypothetical protein
MRPPFGALPRIKRIRTDAAENQSLHLIVDHCLDAQIAWKRDRRLSQDKRHNSLWMAQLYMDDFPLFPFGDPFAK